VLLVAFPLQLRFRSQASASAAQAAVSRHGRSSAVVVRRKGEGEVALQEVVRMWDSIVSAWKVLAAEMPTSMAESAMALRKPAASRWQNSTASAAPLSDAHRPTATCPASASVVSRSW
jgi:hypothetical protein